MGQVIMVFDWDGETVHKETKGFTGKKCVSKTKFLEDALGTASDPQFNSDAYREEPKEEYKNLN